MTRDSLKDICAAPGPFVTAFLPAYHPGAAELSSADPMKTIFQKAAQELQHRRFQGSISQLLQPLEKLVDNLVRFGGRCDSVIFVSPGILCHLRLLAPIRERVVVASHPYITPLLANLSPEREVYIWRSRKNFSA